jgi:hypothetical protein
MTVGLVLHSDMGMGSNEVGAALVSSSVDDFYQSGSGLGPVGFKIRTRLLGSSYGGLVSVVWCRPPALIGNRTLSKAHSNLMVRACLLLEGR